MSKKEILGEIGYSCLHYEAHIEMTLCARRLFARSITKYALFLGRNEGISASVSKLQMGARGR